MFKMYQSIVFSVLTVLLVSVSSAAERADQKVDFARQILPILSNKCFVCHGPDAEEDALRLDSWDSATKDRGGYRAINPVTPDSSEILVRIHDADNPMPPEDADKQLTDAEKELLTHWIQQGGKYEKHWAFIPPQRPDIPTDFADDHPVDSFIRAKLHEQGIELAAEADRRTLARRAALVLTGLPPNPEQLEAYLKDGSPDAYEHFVDEMISSPRFGEHQARYWLDAVRYGDTHGLHLDNRRGIYPYRDWVVRAFNENLPLDTFILWQLAGDLLPDPTTEQLVATGFVRMNPTTAEGGVIPAEFQAKNNFDRVENLGTVLLGMTLTCARCHTHKYDPIPQSEYYELMAFFNSTAEPPLDGNRYEFGPTLKVPANQLGWERWLKRETARNELIQQVEAELRTGKITIPSDQEQVWKSADKNGKLDLIARLPEFDSYRETAADLRSAIAELEKTFTTTLIAKDLEKPRKTFVLKRGEYDQPTGDPVQPDVLSVMGELPKGSPRNRLGLARWLISPQHPLVARVLVNRIWQQTFGYGLVRTPEDFGLQGQQPTHPELLDWLAVELQESGWDQKRMLKLLVTSRTFQQDSAWRPNVSDPDNRLWARGPRFRLDAEVIRDIGLWAGGILDPFMGGEGVKPYQPPGLWSALAHPASNTKKYDPDHGEKLYRRSLYVYWKRTCPHPMMTLFDAPDRESSCVRRSRTNTSLQSLGLLNETQRVEMGRKFAERLLEFDGNDLERLGLAFQMLACRKPTNTEQVACLALLEKMRHRYQQDPEDAESLLKIGEVSNNPSLDAAEHAAWTQVTMMLLASDLAIMLF